MSTSESCSGGAGGRFIVEISYGRLGAAASGFAKYVIALTKKRDRERSGAVRRMEDPQSRGL